jgi:hypothetical protein
MKTTNIQQLPTTPQKWKEGQLVVYFNHDFKTTDDGDIYSAEFTIVKDLKDLRFALQRHFIDPELEQLVIDNIEINGVNAIDIRKEYKETPELTETIDKIITAL